MTATVLSAGGNADGWARLKGTLAFLDRSPLVLDGESAFEAGDGGDHALGGMGDKQVLLFGRQGRSAFRVAGFEGGNSLLPGLFTVAVVYGLLVAALLDFGFLGGGQSCRIKGG